MKKLKIFFVLVLMNFNSFAQINFNKNIICKNSIFKCTEYLVVPKTNPDYYKKPIGLMLKAEFFFDTNGNIIKYFSPNGAVTSHSESKDLKECYFYKDNRIVGMSRVDFDSISVEYLYFDKVNKVYKIKTNDKNERIGLEFIYRDVDNEKEVKKIEIDFHNTTQLNSFAHFNKSNIAYSKNTKKISSSRKVVTITTEQLNLFRISKKLELIENELIKMDKSDFIDEVDFKVLFIYNNKNQLIKETSDGNTIEYFYNDKGLLISRVDKNKNYSFKSQYIYSGNTE
jgi:YD repeat-containing protein